MIEDSIIIHEISQEIQSMVLVEKWFPNFFHTLMNYKINNNHKSNEHKQEFGYDTTLYKLGHLSMNPIEEPFLGDDA